VNETLPPLWSLEILGGLRLARVGTPDGAPVERFRTSKAASLLAYLAYRGGAHSREELCNLFWPDNPIDSARNNLRVTLSTLRGVLEPKGEIEPGQVLLQSLQTVEIGNAVETDVEKFLAAYETVKSAAGPAERLPALEKMLGLYGGPLMAGFYSDWIVVEANRLEDIFISQLRVLLALYESAGEIERAHEAARRAVALTPTREEVLRESMRLGLENGRHTAVVAEFEAWEKGAKARGEAVGAAALELLRVARNLAPPVKESPLVPLLPSKEAPRTLTVPLGRSLPGLWTNFFGRETELATLRQWLSDPSIRLVTVTGPGGAGKTRLALEVARQIAKYPQIDETSWFAMVEWVPLADLAEASLIPGAILDALRVPRGLEQLDDLVAGLRARQGDAPGARLLLVIDNFEHLCDRGAPLLRDLLDSIPELVCLVTSRRLLGFAGEHGWPLQTLEVPSLDTATGKPWVGFETLAPSSVRLFLDRARLVRPNFELTAANAESIAKLCSRLDGLPLTLELAAARVALFSPAQILAGLDQQLERQLNESIASASLAARSSAGDAPAARALQAGTPALHKSPTSLDWTNQDRSAPNRHRSLRAAIAWSERQLPPSVARFWSQLSVFRGGWTLDAAAYVCNAPDAAPFVLALRDVSLIALDTLDELPRGKQLEALREYAAERLTPEAREAALERHARYYTEWSERIAPEFGGGRTARYLARVEDELSNLRAAIEWQLKHDVEGALRIVVALWWTSELRGRVAEGRAAVSRVLAAVQAAFPDLEDVTSEPGDTEGPEAAARRHRLSLFAQAQTGAGKLATVATDFEEARVQLEAALGHFRRLQDALGESDCLYSLGYMRLKCGDVAGARELCDQSIAIHRTIDEPRGLCDALYNRALVALYQADFDTVRTLNRERLIIHRSKGETRGVAISLENLGLASLFSGEIEAARAYLSESLMLFENMREWPSVVRVLWGYGHAIRAAGQHDEAHNMFTRAMVLSREHQLIWTWPYLLEAFAALAAEAGDAPRAARLLGGAGMLRLVQNEPLPSPMFSQEIEQAVARLRAALGESHFESEWQLGSSMSAHALVDFALGEG
jgi:predicted ATPase/DNA-binding SARP family transcriptional activator